MTTHQSQIQTQTQQQSPPPTLSPMSTLYEGSIYILTPPSSSSSSSSSSSFSSSSTNKNSYETTTPQIQTQSQTEPSTPPSTHTYIKKFAKLDIFQGLRLKNEQPSLMIEESDDSSFSDEESSLPSPLHSPKNTTINGNGGGKKKRASSIGSPKSANMINNVNDPWVWVFGGNVYCDICSIDDTANTVSVVRKNKSKNTQIISNNNNVTIELFTFTIVISSDGEESKLNVATDSVNEVTRWIHHINRARRLLQYFRYCRLNSNSNSNLKASPPLKFVIDACVNGDFRVLKASGVLVNDHAISVFVDYFTQFYITDINHHVEVNVVSLSNCGLTDASFKLLLPLLNCTSELRHLNLSYNNLTDISIGALSEVRSGAWKDLIELDISSNFLSKHGNVRITSTSNVSVGRSRSLNKIINQCTHLKKLDVSSNNLPCNTVEDILDTLENMNCLSLEVLNLSSNTLSDNCVMRVCEIMRHSKIMKSLRVLKLNSCAITHVGVNLIADVVGGCRGLEILDFTDNCLCLQDGASSSSSGSSKQIENALYNLITNVNNLQSQYHKLLLSIGGCGCGATNGATNSGGRGKGGLLPMHLKSSMANLNDHCVVDDIVLRRVIHTESESESESEPEHRSDGVSSSVSVGLTSISVGVFNISSTSTSTITISDGIFTLKLATLLSLSSKSVQITNITQLTESASTSISASASASMNVKSISCSINTSITTLNSFYQTHQRNINAGLRELGVFRFQFLEAKKSTSAGSDSVYSVGIGGSLDYVFDRSGVDGGVDDDGLLDLINSSVSSSGNGNGNVSSVRYEDDGENVNVMHTINPLSDRTSYKHLIPRIRTPPTTNKPYAKSNGVQRNTSESESDVKIDSGSLKTRSASSDLESEHNNSNLEGADVTTSVAESFYLTAPPPPSENLDLDHDNEDDRVVNDDVNEDDTPILPQSVPPISNPKSITITKAWFGEKLNARTQINVASILTSQITTPTKTTESPTLQIAEVTRKQFKYLAKPGSLEHPVLYVRYISCYGGDTVEHDVIIGEGDTLDISRDGDSTRRGVKIEIERSGLDDEHAEAALVQRNSSKQPRLYFFANDNDDDSHADQDHDNDDDADESPRAYTSTNDDASVGIDIDVDVDLSDDQTRDQALLKAISTMADFHEEEVMMRSRTNTLRRMSMHMAYPNSPETTSANHDQDHFEEDRRNSLFEDPLSLAVDRQSFSDNSLMRGNSGFGTAPLSNPVIQPSKKFPPTQDQIPLPPFMEKRRELCAALATRDPSEIRHAIAVVQDDYFLGGNKWQKVQPDKGRAYYWNRITGTAQFLRPEDTKDGDVAIAEKLMKRISRLHHLSLTLHIAANDGALLEQYQSFLASCAVLGYAGPEAHNAHKAMQGLIEKKIDNKTIDTKTEFYGMLRIKAEIINLVLQRGDDNIKNIENYLSFLDKARKDGANSSVTTDEENIAKTYLARCRDCDEMIESALKAEKLKVVENTIVDSYALAHFPPSLRELESKRDNMGLKASKILSQIFTAAKQKNISELKRSLASAKSLGINAPGLQEAERLLEKQSALVSEKNAKEAVKRAAKAIASGKLSASNTAELIPVLRLLERVNFETDTTMLKTLAEVKDYVYKCDDHNDDERELLTLLIHSKASELREFLEGKGSDEMTVASATPIAMQEWIDACNKAGRVMTDEDMLDEGYESSDSENEHRNSQRAPNAIMKKGMLMKMSRGKNKGGGGGGGGAAVVGGIANWKERYYVLQGNTLTYYAISIDKKTKTKKGSMLVSAAFPSDIPFVEQKQQQQQQQLQQQLPSPRSLSMTRLSSSTTNVMTRMSSSTNINLLTIEKPNQFKIREGRDLSLVDPMLLLEADRQLRKLQKEQLEKVLLEGMSLQNVEVLKATMLKIEELRLDMKPDVMEEAREIMLADVRAAAKAQLREAVSKCLHAYISEGLLLCEKLNVSEDTDVMMEARELAGFTEVELALQRMRIALEDGNLKHFDVEMHSVKNSASTTHVDKEGLAALLVQQAMRKFRSSMMDGLLVAEEVRILRLALSAVLALRVEIAPMQLLRLTLEIVAKQEASPASSIQTNSNKVSMMMGGMGAMGQEHPFALDKCALLIKGDANNSASAAGSGARLKSLIQSKMITKFANAATTAVGKDGKAPGERKTSKRSVLGEPRMTLTSALTSGMADAGKEADALRLFNNIRTVMTGKSYTSANDPTGAASVKAVSVIAMRIANEARDSEAVADEVYLQLCKFLAAEPAGTKIIYTDSMRCRAWLLLVFLLRSAPVSATLNSYLKHYIETMVQNEEKNAHALVNVMSAAINRQSRNSLPSNSAVMRRILAGDVSAVGAAGVTDLIAADVRKATVYAFKCINHQEKFGKEFYCFPPQARIAANLFDFAPTFIKVLLMSGVYVEVDVRLVFTDTVLPLLVAMESELMNRSIVDITDPKERLEMQRRWNGFAFYEIKNVDKVDLMELPMYPDETRSIDVDSDLSWNCAGDDFQRVGAGKCIILRARGGLRSEKFRSDFFPLVLTSEDYNKNIASAKSLWSKWIRSSTNTSTNTNANTNTSVTWKLPSDATRVELLFMEEVRKINGDQTLYASDTNSLSNTTTTIGDPRSYLCGLELALRLTEEQWLDLASTLVSVTHVSNTRLLLSTMEAIKPLISPGCANLNPRFTYLIQRAYLNYARMWPLYGSQFFKATLNRSDSFTRSAIDCYLAVNGDGLYVLTGQVYDKLCFQCRHADVEKVTGGTESANVLIVEFTKLTLTFDMEDVDAKTLIRLIANTCADILWEGAYLDGSGTGSATLPSGALDSHEMMSEYLHEYPILPVPPQPPRLPRDDRFFRAPSSDRGEWVEKARATEERAGEEAIEEAKGKAEREQIAMWKASQKINGMKEEEEEEEEGKNYAKGDSEGMGKNSKRDGDGCGKVSNTDIDTDTDGNGNTLSSPDTTGKENPSGTTTTANPNARAKLMWKKVSIATRFVASTKMRHQLNSTVFGVPGLSPTISYTVPDPPQTTRRFGAGTTHVRQLGGVVVRPVKPEVGNNRGVVMSGGMPFCGLAYPTKTRHEVEKIRTETRTAKDMMASKGKAGGASFDEGGNSNASGSNKENNYGVVGARGRLSSRAERMERKIGIINSNLTVVGPEDYSGANGRGFISPRNNEARLSPRNNTAANANVNVNASNPMMTATINNAMLSPRNNLISPRSSTSRTNFQSRNSFFSAVVERRSFRIDEDEDELDVEVEEDDHGLGQGQGKLGVVKEKESKPTTPIAAAAAAAADVDAVDAATATTATVNAVLQLSESYECHIDPSSYNAYYVLISDNSVSSWTAPDGATELDGEVWLGQYQIKYAALYQVKLEEQRVLEVAEAEAQAVAEAEAVRIKEEEEAKEKERLKALAVPTVMQLSESWECHIDPSSYNAYYVLISDNSVSSWTAPDGATELDGEVWLGQYQAKYAALYQVKLEEQRVFVAREEEEKEAANFKIKEMKVERERREEL